MSNIITIEYEGIKLSVVYAFDLVPSLTKGRYGSSHQTLTTAVIRLWEPSFENFFGSTICNPNDVGDRELGKRQALRRAYRELAKYLVGVRPMTTFTWKIFRTLLWEAQHGKKNEGTDTGDDQGEG